MIPFILLIFIASAIMVDVSPAPPVTSPLITKNTTPVNVCVDGLEHESGKILCEPKKKTPAKKQKPKSQHNASLENKPIIPPTAVKVDSPFIKQLNQVRQQNGLNPLRENQQLNAQSQAWANQTSESVPHSGYPGEVQAWSCGYEMNALQEWLNSSSHYAIIMDPNITSIGYGQSDRGDCHYYVAQVE